MLENYVKIDVMKQYASKILSASEIADHEYCNVSWFLNRQGCGLELLKEEIQEQKPDIKRIIQKVDKVEKLNKQDSELFHSYQSVEKLKMGAEEHEKVGIAIENIKAKKVESKNSQKIGYILLFVAIIFILLGVLLFS